MLPLVPWLALSFAFRFVVPLAPDVVVPVVPVAFTFEVPVVP